MLKLNSVTLEKIYSLCHSKEQLKTRYLVLEWIYFLFSGKMVSLGEALNVFILLAVTLTFTSAQDAGI